MVDVRPGQGREVEMDELVPSRGLLDDLRGRATQAMDELAFLRWKLGGVIALAVIAGLVFFVAKQGQYVPSPAAVDAVREKIPLTTTSSAPPTTVADLVVHVGGAVARPGIYTLRPQARVADAVSAAGGATSEADVDQLNLAEHVSDGQRVYVAKMGQTPPSTSDSGSSTGGSPSMVNINTATASQLEALPGVGPSTAEAIIAYRSEHGPFTSVDDLASVKGIGPSKLAQIKGRARV